MPNPKLCMKKENEITINNGSGGGEEYALRILKFISYKIMSA